jgi:hypothetical protein
MPPDAKRDIYGAARILRINHVRSDVMTSCSKLMYAKDPVPVTFSADAAEDRVVYMDPVDAIVISLEAMLAEIARLEAGATT